MRNVLPVCAGLVVISGVVSANLWLQLRTERQRTADLSTQLKEAKVARVSMAQPQRIDAAPAATPSTAAVSETKADAPAPAKPTQVNTVQGIVNSLTQEKELLKDPEYRKARLAMQRINMARNYPGLVEELGLSEKDADRLFDLLAENQLVMNSEASFSIGANGQPDQAAFQERMRKQQELQRQQEESVAALLGPGKYAQWQDYQQTRMPRMQATSLGAQLAQVGQPLSEAQHKALTTTLIAEQKRQREDSQSMARNINRADPQAVAQLQEEAMKRQEQSNRRILEAAASSLNPRQLDALREQYEMQAAMNRASSRLQRARQEAQGGTTQAVPGQAITVMPSF
ncbi:MAG: hypothetical protein ABIQ86_12680 [Steroidobacteraceae bacterium]